LGCDVGKFLKLLGAFNRPAGGLADFLDGFLEKIFQGDLLFEVRSSAPGWFLRFLAGTGDGTGRV
jgi:hypothetical protein